MIAPYGSQWLIISARNATGQYQVAMRCHNGNCNCGVLHLSMIECQRCRLLAVVYGQYILSAVQAVDSHDITLLAFPVDNDGSFVEDRPPLALHRYGAYGGKHRETRIMHEDDS